LSKKTSTKSKRQKKSSDGTKQKLRATADGKSSINPESNLSSFPVVGIGASAGGLDALKSLFENLANNSGLAFVVIQHLTAGQTGILTEILSHSTSMHINKVKDGVKVEPNNIYVVPSGYSITIADSVLRLHLRGSSLKLIDAFLISLATERKTHAIGVILSGTGTDGTKGLKAVKAEGGITFAQDPQTAQYPSMPQSAIDADSAYFVLPPSDIAAELSRVMKHPEIIHAEMEAAAQPKLAKEEAARTIFAMLNSAFGVDFTHYKESTIGRRITRRMVINQISSLDSYVDFLHSHPKELQALFNDMLIGVTNFFREPNTFEVLHQKVCPEIIKNLSQKASIRIWVPGCSTGEDVYSVAITLHEFLDERKKSDQSIQIFGTDLNEKNVEKSRQGIYPKNIEAYVSEQRLRKYFTRSNNDIYQISKFIREMCVFAKQDVTKDPPFSNIDLIFCRNMLIYFDTTLQERVLPILHYALKPSGFLVLGESESVGKFTDLFESIEKKGTVFIKKRASSQITFGFDPFQTSKLTPLKKAEKKDWMGSLREDLDRLLMSRFVPAMILVNKDLDILFFRGNMALFLLPECGEASLNVNKMLREELKLEVQTGVYRAKRDNKSVLTEHITYRANGEIKSINIEILPIKDKNFDEIFYLIIFREPPVVAVYPETAAERAFEREKQSRVEQLQDVHQELESTKQSLQTIIEEQEATNEELRAAMEEVQSSNEELQSTNEELETAKEELQSTNEELKTLNDELKNRNRDLARLNDDLSNLIKNIDVSLVMVDNSLKIRRFTPSSQETLGLVPADIGRRITSIRLNIPVQQLEKMIEEVSTKLSIVKTDLQNQEGRWFELWIRPYITEEKRIDGAVISFIDIDEIKKLEKTLRDHSDSLEDIVKEKTLQLKDAERLSGIGETAGMIGHDIRNPLQSITGTVYLAKEEIETLPENETKKSLQESISVIEQQTDYISKIVSDLQDYAKKLCPEIGTHSLPDLISHALKATKIPKNIQIITEIPINTPQVSTDPSYLQRTLLNLFSNSIQAMPNGGKIIITAQPKDGKIQLSITDTGTGIAQEQKEKIFKPLFTTKAKGQGFGLAVCKRLMDAQNSAITFVSEPSKGTTFTIQLSIAH
jgi:two-component system CheB/CheR fusion protein